MQASILAEKSCVLSFSSENNTVYILSSCFGVVDFRSLQFFIRLVDNDDDFDKETVIYDVRHMQAAGPRRRGWLIFLGR